MMDELRGDKKGRFVGLLSDFGYESFYVGVMKAVVYNAAPSAHLVDITHDIPPHGILDASFILATVFDFFPRGTVFLAVVDPGVGGDRENLVFKIKGRYLVCPDNGLVSDLAGTCGVEAIFEIDEEVLPPFQIHPGVGRTFLGRDVFAPVTGAIARGTPIENLGKTAASFDTLDIPPVLLERNRIVGCGRYIDHFGNVLTNITGDHLKRVFGGQTLDRIRPRVGTHVLERINECYIEQPPRTLMAVLNSWNLIEVSVNEGRAADILSVSGPREVQIELEI